MTLFQVDEVTTIVNDLGEAIGRLNPGRNYEAVRVDEQVVVMAGPNGSSGYVGRSLIRFIDEASPTPPKSNSSRAKQRQSQPPKPDSSKTHQQQPTPPTSNSSSSETASNEAISAIEVLGFAAIAIGALTVAIGFFVMDGATNVVGLGFLVLLAGLGIGLRSQPAEDSTPPTPE